MQKANEGELSNLRNELLAEQVQGRIYQYIPDTPIAAGAKLPNESELGDRFGMGGSTIREAVKLLISRGILEVRRGSGTYAASITPVDMGPLSLGAMEDKVAPILDLVNVHIILEPRIAEMVALSATEGDVEKLRNLCDSMERKIKVGDSYVEGDIAFHACVAECSKNKVVEQLIPVIDMAVLMLVSVTHKKLTDETIMTHRAVTGAIAKRDPIGVRTTMMMHMTFNRSMIRQLMRDGREAQGWVY